MEQFTDGIVRRALAYMGYSTLQANLFMNRAYPHDRAMLVADAVAAGFNLDAVRALDGVVEHMDAAVIVDYDSLSVKKDSENGKS